VQAFQIRIDPVRGRTPISLLRFTLGAAFFLLPLLHLPSFFAIPFGDGRFSWTSDGRSPFF
jgi:hypothetical protein